MAEIEQQSAQTASSAEEAGGCMPPLWVMPLLLVAVIAALLISLRFMGVLAAVIDPADAPRPAGIVQLSHRSAEHGVHDWRYETSLNPCEVVAFYEAQNSVCRVIDNRCDGTTFNAPDYSLESVARCVGYDTFSAFGLRWEVEISTDYNPSADPQTVTYFDLSSEALWGGQSEVVATP